MDSSSPRRSRASRSRKARSASTRLPQDAALARLARIVHGADFPEEMDATPESPGLWAISQGFTELGLDDSEVLARASFLYDSLYAHLGRVGAGS